MEAMAGSLSCVSWMAVSIILEQLSHLSNRLFFLTRTGTSTLTFFFLGYLYSWGVIQAALVDSKLASTQLLSVVGGLQVFFNAATCVPVSSSPPRIYVYSPTAFVTSLILDPHTGRHGRQATRTSKRSPDWRRIASTLRYLVQLRNQKLWRHPLSPRHRRRHLLWSLVHDRLPFTHPMVCPKTEHGRRIHLGRGWTRRCRVFHHYSKTRRSMGSPLGVPGHGPLPPRRRPPMRLVPHRWAHHYST